MNKHQQLMALKKDVEIAFWLLPKDVQQDFYAEVNGTKAFLNENLIKDILTAAKRFCGHIPTRADIAKAIGCQL